MVDRERVSRRQKLVGGVWRDEMELAIGRVTEEFIPSLPISTVLRLAKTEGKAWLVYLILRQLSAMRGSNTVELTTSRLVRYGVNRRQKYRALTSLASVGLIRVERRLRKNPLVTLLEEKLRP